MLELKNITIRLKKDGRCIVDDFSFSLNRGEKAVIIGEEGNGKSTLLRFLYQRDLVEEYCSVSGEVIKKGKIAYLPQMMEEGLSHVTLLDYFGDSESSVSKMEPSLHPQRYPYNKKI